MVRKIKVVKRYNDIVLKEIKEVGMFFEAEDKRAEHLVNEKVAEYVPERQTTEKKE